MIRSHEGPKVLEVNSSPGLEGVEGTTKIDIAGLMIQHIEDNVDMPKAKPKKKAKTKKK
jgi:ribosomal protein S6--L-glutamate ligase